MKYFSFIDFSKVRYSELSQFVSSVVAVVEKHNPEALKITEFFTMLKVSMPELEKLFDKEESNKELTASLQALIERRQKLVVATRQQLVSTMASTALQAKALELKPKILVYLRNFSDGNQKERNEKMFQILKLTESAETNTLFADLGLTVYLTELSEVQNRIMLIEKQVSEKKSIKKFVNRRELAFNARELFRNLLSAIELAVVLNPETDYRPLISELNVVLGDYQAKINSRTTRRQNTIKKETVALSPTTTATA